MKINELMQGHVPNASYQGISTADDMVLAVDVSGTKDAAEAEYLVAQGGITEHSGELNPQTQTSQYMRTGQNTVKTGNQRVITIKGDRILGDEFQEFLLSHEIKYGVGAKVVVPYLYFNVLTGIGEKGMATVLVEEEPSGAAGENSSFVASLNAITIPELYVYA